MVNTRQDVIQIILIPEGTSSPRGSGYLEGWMMILWWSQGECVLSANLGHLYTIPDLNVSHPARGRGLEAYLQSLNKWFQIMWFGYGQRLCVQPNLEWNSILNDYHPKGWLFGYLFFYLPFCVRGWLRNGISTYTLFSHTPGKFGFLKFTTFSWILYFKSYQCIPLIFLINLVYNNIGLSFFFFKKNPVLIL